MHKLKHSWLHLYCHSTTMQLFSAAKSECRMFSRPYEGKGVIDAFWRRGAAPNSVRTHPLHSSFTHHLQTDKCLHIPETKEKKVCGVTQVVRGQGCGGGVPAAGPRQARGARAGAPALAAAPLRLRLSRPGAQAPAPRFGGPAGGYSCLGAGTCTHPRELCLRSRRWHHGTPGYVLQRCACSRLR